ncbi:MAG: hypothetical protein HXY53_03850 [Nitrospirae bacterium]|nr:hypothetical protein [Nitrospirota bacterium]
MKINEQKIIFLSFIFPIYLFLIWFIVGPFISKIYISKSNKQVNEQAIYSAISYDKRNATYPYFLGRYYHYYSEDPDNIKAIGFYIESLKHCPLQGGCWLDLAKAYRTAGMTAQAEYAINRAISIMPKNPVVMWEAGVLYLIAGDIEKSIRNFREFIVLRPDRQQDAYDMVWKIPLNSEYILKNLIPAEYSYYKNYLLYLISINRINETRDLWRTMNGLKIEDDIFIKYIDFMILNHQYEDAENIWNKYVHDRFKVSINDNTSILWNGSFELDILNGGFDWKVSETKGVDVFLDRDIHISGRNSLGVTFDGTQNPDITIASQIVRVNPGSNYLLTGFIKTNSITTTNGLFLSVQGHDCKGFNKNSDILTGTNFWKELNLEFNIPPECNAIIVKIRRDRSHKFDNKISGSAWIDGISLTQR